MQEAPSGEEAPPDERFGAAMDRWEPGSDFESKTVARSRRSRRAGAAANSGVQDPAAQPLMQASDARPSEAASADAGTGAEAAVSGPAASDGVADRLGMRLCFIFACWIELVFCRLLVHVSGASRLLSGAILNSCRQARFHGALAAWEW